MTYCLVNVEKHMKRPNKKKLMRDELCVDQKIWAKHDMEGIYYGYDPRISLGILRKTKRQLS